MNTEKKVSLYEESFKVLAHSQEAVLKGTQFQCEVEQEMEIVKMYVNIEKMGEWRIANGHL